MNDIKKVSLPHKVAQTAYKINQSLSKVLIDFDIAPEQRVILEVIDKNKKVSQNELSQYLKKDKTTVSRTLDVIERKGYIVRKYTNEDKRIKFITLTSFGKEALDKTEKTVNLFREKTLNNFSKEEIDTFYHFLEKLTLNIESEE
ncbi:transcriptional regulator, MarR family [Arcobacter nitrofigilis DSM 7299]|uniref:Transcriptional regulator, MarR family n=1 Tax=Arcobacter nitrofigilis (strain ATCC 33309 / DSM 7299 / CCUG 15893 / LMG 7604 / NCTC 12251 / CI) TaxID=572480 RepID=D5V451_ARCNC|nr:MarR family winged helix-turn-helix transcriptional regulator [Arcobacter nitrofigilis]ADG91784.1 transcriptional regulator, MarR family [Arcobacter nitrofigilis DSM 7299]